MGTAITFFTKPLNFTAGCGGGILGMHDDLPCRCAIPPDVGTSRGCFATIIPHSGTTSPVKREVFVPEPVRRWREADAPAVPGRQPSPPGKPEHPVPVHARTQG